MLTAIKMKILKWALKKYINKKNLIKWAKALLVKVDKWTLNSKTNVDNVVADHLKKEFGIEK